MRITDVIKGRLKMKTISLIIMVMIALVACGSTSSEKSISISASDENRIEVESNDINNRKDSNSSNTWMDIRQNSTLTMRKLVKSFSYCQVYSRSDFTSGDERSTALKLVAYLDEYYWREILSGRHHNSPSSVINQMMRNGCDEDYYYLLSEELDSRISGFIAEIDNAIRKEDAQYIKYYRR